MEGYAWLIILFPILGVIVNGFFGRRIGKLLVSLVACAAVGLSFLVAAVLFFGFTGPAKVPVFQWITVGDFRVSATLLIDQLSLLMTLVVTGVGFLIHVYSTGYMADDARYARYFTYLNLFVASMLVLVLGSNFLVMYIGWELVGLCSYLLIGFWFERKSAADAGKKAFLVNRVGDFGFALGVMLIFAVFGTLDFDTVFEQAPMALPGAGFVATVITLLLFMGATGKSAQIPLYVWLPDAMEGPTPVSALIHAATMVTAGVYMVARTHVLFELAPVTMLVVASIGTLTAFFAATIAVVQNDIKRILAYSTISQLGYMFLGVGVGAYAAGIFHLTTHAFFKALLFLGAGSVMHALAGELDIQKMGGLARKLPWTAWTFAVGALALAGFPGLSGFFSKDEILWRAFSDGHPWLWGLGVLTAGLTAFYIFRAVFLAFFGTSRLGEEAAAHAHESPGVMVGPLVVLAVLAVVGGYIGVPAILGGGNAVEHFLAPVFESGHTAEAVANEGLEWTLMGVSVAVALLGIALAYVFYVVNPGIPKSLAESFRPVHTVLWNKYYVDELYLATVVHPLRRLAGWLASVFDDRVIDGTVNFVGRFFGWGGVVTGQVQTGQVRSYALMILAGVVVVVGYFLSG